VLDRGLLERLPRQLLSRGSRLKPAVFRIELADGPAILKDCAGAPRWSRPLARWLLDRELRAIARLAGLAGFPRLLARVDADALLISVLPGAALHREIFAADPRRWSQALRERVRAMHGRAVFHLDLRQPQNLLADEEQGLSVVDFGAAFAPGPLGRRLYGRLLGWVDRQAVLKYLAKFAPQEMGEAEARSYLRGHFWRRLWVFTPHHNQGAAAAVRRRLQDLSAGRR
jgi:hypothetical protein